MKAIRTLLGTTIAALSTIACVGTVSAAPEFPSDQTMTLRLVDVRTSAPIAKATVYAISLVDGEVYAGLTDSNGKVQLSGLYGDEFDVIVRSTKTHCGGHLWYDAHDVHPADAFVSNADWGTWSSRDLGTAAMRQRSAWGSC